MDILNENLATITLEKHIIKPISHFPDNQQNSTQGPASIAHYAAIIWRGKWRVLGILLLVFSTVMGLTFMMSPTFESVVSLLVDTRQSPSALFQDTRSLGMSVDVMQNELALLSSRLLRDDVAEQLVEYRQTDSVTYGRMPLFAPVEGDTANPVMASLETVTIRLGDQVGFSSERESYVLTITANSSNAKEAALIANTFASAYVTRNVLASRAKSRAFRTFLETQLAEKKQALEKKEDSLQIYMKRWGIVSLDAESAKLIDRTSELEKQRDECEIEIQSLLSQLVSYKEQINLQEKSLAKSIGEANDPYIRLLQEQLATLEVQRDITISQHPAAVREGVYSEKLKEIDGQIQELRNALQARTEQYIANILPAADGPEAQKDPTGYLKQIKEKFLQTQIEIQTLQAKRDALNNAIVPYDQAVASLPGKTVEFTRLYREKSSLEQIYLSLETKYNEAQVTEQSEFGYVEIFDPAVVPEKASSPKPVLNGILGIILGLGMGIGVVLGKELVAQRLHAPEDLVRRGLLPLSTVMRVEKKYLKGTDGKDRQRSDSYQLVVHTPNSPAAEAFRHLRTNLHLPKGAAFPRTIMVTSSEPGEGKTTVACNLASIMAQAGTRVLLVDGDMREPSVHRAFGLNAKKGLVQVLKGEPTEDNINKDVRVPNLHVLCSGGTPLNAGELIVSGDMGFLVSQLSEQYDVVIFDSPPVLAVNDALALSRLVETTIVVASAGITRSVSLEHTIEVLKNVGANVLGVVLNKFDRKKAYGVFAYGRGYGHYGHAARYGAKTNGQERTK